MSQEYSFTRGTVTINDLPLQNCRITVDRDQPYPPSFADVHSVRITDFKLVEGDNFCNYKYQLLDASYNPIGDIVEVTEVPMTTFLACQLSRTLQFAFEDINNE